MTDMDTFIADSQGKIFRIYKYKRVYTPYEQEQKYSDESEYENGGYAEFVFIKQAIELPDGDVLLKLEKTYKPSDDFIFDEYDKKYKSYRYEKLSDIVIEEYDIDNTTDDE